METINKPDTAGPDLPPPANDQEFFDRAVAHLRKQGEPAIAGGSSTCFYTLELEDRILHCAVGGPMPSHLRAAALEEGVNTNGVNTLYHAVPAAYDYFRAVDRGLMEEVQDIHDTDPSGTWESALTRLAIRRKLTMPPLGVPA